MKITSRGHYGLQIIAALAKTHGTGPVRLSKIAKDQGVPAGYAEQLMMSLKKAGLVRSFRGSLGGYELSRQPGKISIGEILTILEGPATPIKCVTDEICGLEKHCMTKNLWTKIYKKIDGALNSLTLKEALSV